MDDFIVDDDGMDMDRDERVERRKEKKRVVNVAAELGISNEYVQLHLCELASIDGI